MIAILFGAVFFVIGFLALFFYYRFFKTAIIVPGTITGFKSYQQRDKENGREITMYHTIAGFEFDGQMREIVTQSSSSVKPKIGETVKIGVNPKDIKEARIYSKSSVLCFWLFLLMGTLVMGLGIAEICGILPN